MKRLIPATIIMLAIISVFIFSSRFTYKNSERLSRKIEICRNEIAASDYAAADTALKSLKEYWGKINNDLALFINHKLLDGITQSITELEANLEAESRADFLENCAEIEYYVNQTVKEHKFSLESFY